jgi:hypothetical protein
MGDTVTTTSAEQCPACGHVHDKLCTWDLMYTEKGHPEIPPFFLQCWCDGMTGPVIGSTPIADQSECQLVNAKAAIGRRA